MKVAILGATGFVGRPILDEALSHPDLRVTAIVRSIGKLPEHERLEAKSVDIHDSAGLAAAMSGHDAVIHAYHPGRDMTQSPDVYEKSVSGHEAIIAAVRQSGVERLLCVGGAASLLTEDGSELIDSPRWNSEFDSFKPAILGTRALYYLLKEEQELDWVFLAPSEWLRPGERTGRFRVGQNHLLIDETGTSAISLEDYAVAMVQELVEPRHHRERFTVGY